MAACAADARVAAAFLTGSYAAGTADAHSDVDLGVITADAAYDDFLTSREPFVRLLGEPVFVETFAQLEDSDPPGGDPCQSRRTRH